MSHEMKSYHPRQMELTPELVVRCYRKEPDPGPNPNFTPIEDSERRSIAKALIASAPPGPLWVFAYGSLIWRPDFEVAEFRRATASGWHRSFCLELTRWRGTPALPGLMLALQSGGRCNGVGLRLPKNESAIGGGQKFIEGRHVPRSPSPTKSHGRLLECMFALCCCGRHHRSLHQL